MSVCRRMAVIVGGLSLAALALALSGRLQVLAMDDHLRGLFAGVGIGGLFTGLFLWFTPDLRDSAPPALSRRYYRELLPPMAAYVAVMLAWKRLLDMVETVWLRALVALLPALLVALLIRAAARYVRDSDEMQRRIELESIGIAAGLTGAVFMAAGFLQSARLIAVPGGATMLGVFPSLCLFYGVARIVIARRYG